MGEATRSRLLQTPDSVRLVSEAAARLHWAIKPSFVAYIEALPDGGVELLDGVICGADGVFVFPASEAAGELEFTGAVRFRGHQGVLDVTIREPRIESVDGAIRVTVAVGAERVHFATATGPLLSEDDDLSTPALAATDDGAALLGGVYQPGTELEPFHVYGAAA